MEIRRMPTIRRGKKRSNVEPSLRASVSFPRELYHTLEVIARQKKVSLAWVMRDAAEKYVAEQSPVLKGR
jgi:metal-responsive CopG/Arc/MetJ family transcriptional regulator